MVYRLKIILPAIVAVATFREKDGQIAPTAFSLRHNEVYLSVRWLEFFEQPNRSSEIEEVRRVLKADLKIGATAKIAVLNVGDVRNYVEEVSGYLIKKFCTNRFPQIIPIVEFLILVRMRN